jgi:integrase
MTVRVETRNGRLRYDIRTKGPTGRVRERADFPAILKTEAARQRWAHEREMVLTRNGRAGKVTDAAPTLEVFGARWMREYAVAEGNKPATIDAKERILRLHLYPALGTLRLDAIDAAAISKLKLRIAGNAPKTRHNILGQLGTILGTAKEWKLLADVPTIDKPKLAVPEMAFYDFPEWERLVDGARKAGPMHLAMVLLGGEAGLRRGELVALEQTDLWGGTVIVRHNEWNGIIGTPKGGNKRTIPMTPRLAEAVKAIRHDGKRVFVQAKGKRAKVTTLQSWLEVCCRRAGLSISRDLHRLRHTFCSHLALRNVSPKAIQELAGHADLSTTMHYMHLAPGSKADAIAALVRGSGGDQSALTVRS